MAQNGGCFARHAEVAPQVGAVGDGFVVDLDDAVRAAGERRADGAGEFNDAGGVAVEAEFGAAGQHAVALDSVDDLLADGGAADYDLVAVEAGLDAGLHVVAAGDRFDGYDARGAGLGQQPAGFFDALALGGAHGDEALQLAGRSVQRRDVFANPVV